LSSTRPFAHPDAQSPLACDGVSLETLAKKYGTPLYIYSAEQVLHRLRLFTNAFESISHMVCYSVKANSVLAILKLLDQNGAGFDIVSGGELERILRVNKEAAQRVVFSGVGKTAAEIDLALRYGILIFNVESAGELDLLAERASKLRKHARVAIRVNPDVFAETHPYISTGLREHKFGIDIRQARAIYKAAAKHKFLNPCGVSVHIGSQIRSTDPFGAAAERIAQLVLDLRTDGLAINSVDVGGGLGIEYHADHRFKPEEKIQQYATALLKALRPIEKLKLLLEPGRFIVAQAGALLTRVLYVKKNGEKTFVVTDAGMNDLIRPALYQAHHDIVPVIRRKGARRKTVDVVGPVCETGDFFARDRELPEVKSGDLVAILDAGAYGLSLSSNYNSRPRPAEVLVEGKRARLIRRRETIDDLLAVELMEST
jgi:diaminopimelate decarboxylase